MRVSTEAASATSVLTAITSPPLALISSTMRAISSSLREASTTVALSWAKSRAVAAPIPRLAPVMSATLPSRWYFTLWLKLFICCLLVIRCYLLSLNVLLVAVCSFPTQRNSLYMSPVSAILLALSWVRVSGHALPSDARRTRDEQARSQPEDQRDRHHDKRAGELRLGGHQEVDAQQQGSQGLQGCQQDRGVGALPERLGQRPVGCLSCQPIDGAPAWLDERGTEWGYQDQADQRDVNPAGPEAPGGKRHVEPCGEDEQHADPRHRALHGAYRL